MQNISILNCQIDLMSKAPARFRAYILITFLSSSVVLNFSCEKFVEVPPPKTQLTAASAFADDGTATATMIGIYDQIINSYPFLPYYLPLCTGYSSDELKNYSVYPELAQFYSNSLNPVDNTLVYNLWSNFYKDIYQSNAVIEGIQSSDKLSEAVATQLTGEAKFLRAFMHFYLVNLWGDVPLITFTDYKLTARQFRKSKSEVYDQIIADFQDAKSLLKEDFVDKTSLTPTTDRVRPTRWAAAAMLSRVYLYLGRWQEAQAEADIVINNSEVFHLEGDLNNVFLKNNNEAIWQIMMPQPNNSIGSAEGFNFILPTGPMTGINNCSTISTQLLNAFEPGDQRKTNWISSVTADVDTFYFPFKYKVQESPDPSEYSTVLRLAELFLIRSEAKAQQGDLTGAAEDLNAVRNRAGLEDTAANGLTDLLKAIMHERQVELFTEWGHRWMDLKRTASIDTIMNSVAPEKSTFWSSDWALYPIPRKELNANPNLVQNQGY